MARNAYGRFPFIIFVLIVVLLSVPVFMFMGMRLVFLRERLTVKSKNIDYLPIFESYRDTDKLEDVRIIPATHNSAGLAVSPASIGGFILTFYKTQSFLIASQLQMGIRFFDLRVASRKGEYYITHMMFTKFKLIDVLQTLIDFLQDHPKEIVFVYIRKDFNYLKKGNFDDLARVIALTVHEANLPNPGEDETSFFDFEIAKFRGKLVVLHEYGGCFRISDQHGCASWYIYKNFTIKDLWRRGFFGHLKALKDINDYVNGVNLFVPKGENKVLFLDNNLRIIPPLVSSIWYNSKLLKSVKKNKPTSLGVVGVDGANPHLIRTLVLLMNNNNMP
jgi:hypothetical protein